MFEWDKEKNRSNIYKHGIDFDMASRFLSECDYLKKQDTRINYEEPRYSCIGSLLGSNGSLVWLYVVITYRGNKVRIISARRANKRERRIFENEFKR